MTIVEACDCPELPRLLFHVDEAMSWESVRDLGRMRRALTLVENIARQADLPASITENIVMVRDYIQELLNAIAEGKA